MRGAENTFDIDKARELVGNQLLWPRVRDFLWDFAPSIHSTWIEEKFGSLEVWKFGLGDDQTSKHPNLQTSTRLKRFILDSLGVEPCFHDFPKDDGSRLALLDGATLLEIAKWLGALACADELRKVTDGETVRALKAALPGVYPEVFGYTAYFPQGDFQRRGAETQSLPESVAALGCAILLAALANLPASLVSRLTFKFPKDLCASAPLREKKDTVALSAILKLLKLKFPEAYSLCCS